MNLERSNLPPKQSIIFCEYIFCHNRMAVPDRPRSPFSKKRKCCSALCYRRQRYLDKRKSKQRGDGRYRSLKICAFEKICGGNISCFICYENNPQILEINHLISGRGKEDRDRYPSNDALYQSIISGARPIVDLSILCPTHHRLFHKTGDESISELLKHERISFYRRLSNLGIPYTPYISSGTDGNYLIDENYFDGQYI